MAHEKLPEGETLTYIFLFCFGYFKQYWNLKGNEKNRTAKWKKQLSKWVKRRASDLTKTQYSQRFYYNISTK